MWYISAIKMTPAAKMSKTIIFEHDGRQFVEYLRKENKRRN